MLNATYKFSLSQVIMKELNPVPVQSESSTSTTKQISDGVIDYKGNDGRAKSLEEIGNRDLTFFPGLSNSSLSQSPSSSSWPWAESYYSWVASLAFLSTGILRAYTSPALLSIQNEGIMLSSLSGSSKKHILSWIASTPPLFSLLGNILSLFTLERFGRQKTLVLLTFPSAIGWILIANASSIWILLLGRALTGLSSGLATATAPLYITELKTPPAIRGCLGLLPGMMLAAGILLGFVLAHQFQNWKTLAAVISMFSILFSGLSLTIAESPTWLEGQRIKRARETEACQFDLEMELVVPPATSMKNKRKPSEKTGLIPKKGSSLSTISPLIFPACICLALMLFQQLSGGNVIIYYLSEILTKNCPPSDTKEADLIHKGSLIIGLVQFVGFFLALPLIDRVGRRALLITSALLMSLPHVVLGFHFYGIRRNGNELFNLSSLPLSNNAKHDYVNDWLVLRVSSLCVLLSCYSIGLGPIPFLFIEILFPCGNNNNNSVRDHVGTQARSYVACLSSLVNHFALFVIVKLFPYLFDMGNGTNEEAAVFLGPDVTFWGFAVVCWAAALFVLLFVPETKTA